MLIDDLNEASEQFEADKKKFVAKGKKLFAEAAKQVLGNGIDAIAWTQYAPHFNDGDACTFGVNDVFAFTRLAPGEEPRNYTEYDLEGYKNFDHDTPEFRKLCKFICGNEGLMEDLFGEGLVVVTAAGVEVQDYDHD